MSQTPAPPRPRKSPKLSKIAALEKRLEELSSHVRHDSSSRSPTPSPEAETEPVSELCSKADSWDFNHLFPLKQSSAGSHAPHPPASDPGKPRPWDSWWPTPHEAELLLANYRNIHACLFPFARVPEHLTALEVRENRPFMWKAIMMVGCFLDGARQVKLGEELLAEIGRAAVVDGLRSLDLLHGLQMLVAWWVTSLTRAHLGVVLTFGCRFHYALKGSQVTNLLFLARSMCVNLTFKEDASLQGEAMERNLDHMRAYAGTYYLNTL